MLASGPGMSRHGPASDSRLKTTAREWPRLPGRTRPHRQRVTDSTHRSANSPAQRTPYPQAPAAFAPNRVICICGTLTTRRPGGRKYSALGSDWLSCGSVLLGTGGDLACSSRPS